MLVSQNLPLEMPWRVYLSVLIASIAFMAPLLVKAEKKNRLALLLKVSVVFMLVAQTYFGVIIFGNYQSIWTICFGLFLFFIGFNLLEALQPSLVSRLSGDNRGAGLGIYNTTMSIGLFLGGALGGAIYGLFGTLAIFEMDALLLLAWLIIAARMSELPPKVKLP